MIPAKRLSLKSTGTTTRGSLKDRIKNACRNCEKTLRKYRHIWDGFPNDDSDGETILPYALLELCTQAADILKFDIDEYSGRIDAGLDLAGEGDDFNCLVMRRGPIITHVEQWHTNEEEQGQRAHRRCIEFGVRRLFYDAGGGYGDNLKRSIQAIAPFPDRTYIIEPVLFGESVRGPEEDFLPNVTNKDYFMYRNSQLAWALRSRMYNTIDMLSTGRGRIDRCLFIDPRIPNLQAFLIQLTQPVYEESKAHGKIVINKKPDNKKSPDMFDGASLAFTWESRDGLRHR